MKMEKIKPYLIFTLSLCIVFVFEVAIIFKIQNYNTNAITVDIINSVNTILIILKSFVFTLFVSSIVLSYFYFKKNVNKGMIKVLLLINFLLIICFTFFLIQWL